MKNDVLGNDCRVLAESLVVVVTPDAHRMLNPWKDITTYEGTKHI
jgi:hypothetical protein